MILKRTQCVTHIKLTELKEVEGEIAIKISIETLQKTDMPVEITIHSLQRCLYQARVRVGRQELLVCDGALKPLTRTSLALMCETLQGIPTRSLQLAQSLPYDEMIGQPFSGANSTHIQLSIPSTALQTH